MPKGSPTDYILFNHGVSTRERRFQPKYADELFQLVQEYCEESSAYKERGRTLRKIALYWGDVNKDEEDLLLMAYQKAPIWKQLWFTEFREKQIMQFVGDGALYISRFCGAKVAKALLEMAAKELQDYESECDNFVHPGDPVAYPLEIILPQLVDGDSKYLAVKDVLTYPAELLDFLTEPVSQTTLALLHGGAAHGSYWQSDQVAQIIAQAIVSASELLPVTGTVR